MEKKEVKMDKRELLILKQVSLKAAANLGGTKEEVVVNAKYGPYVEFNTRKGFGVPTRKYNITNKNILPYASIFRGTNSRNNNMPYRSYLFSNFEIEYSKALKRIRAFKIK